MSFNCQSGRCCYRYSTDTGATSTLYNVSVDGINVTAYEFANPTVAITDATVAANIKLSITGGTLPAGVVVTKLASCLVETSLRDSYEELCFKDSTGELQLKGTVGLNVTKLTNTVESLDYINVTKVKTGSTVATGEYNELTTVPALYVSGSFATKNLKVTIGGVEYTQGDCLSCGC